MLFFFLLKMEVVYTRQFKISLGIGIFGRPQFHNGYQRKPIRLTEYVYSKYMLIFLWLVAVFIKRIMTRCCMSVLIV